jgi:uncharacterized protein YukE
MTKESEKIAVLRDKLEASELDSRSIDLLSAISDELRRLQKTRATIDLSLSDKLRHLDHRRATLLTKIQARRPLCAVMRDNEATVSSIVEPLALFLKEFQATVPSLGSTVLENLKANDDFTTVLEESVSERKSGDVMQQLFDVFRTSLEDMREDKAYFLTRLTTMNDIADAMGKYLETLVDTFEDTEDEDKEDDSANKVMLGHASMQLKKAAAPLQSALDAIDKVAQETSETGGKGKSPFHSAFKNFDQKANQLFNILSTIMKATKEMRSAVTRNIL